MREHLAAAARLRQIRAFAHRHLCLCAGLDLGLFRYGILDLCSHCQEGGLNVGSSLQNSHFQKEAREEKKTKRTFAEVSKNGISNLSAKALAVS